MTPVKYKIGRTAFRKEKFIFPFLFVVFAVLAILDFREAIQDGNWIGWNVLKGSVFAIAAAGALTNSVLLLCFGSVGQNYISLDGEGLSLSRWGHCKKWSWQDLSSFAVTKSPSRGLKIIRLPVPGAVDWRARIGARPGVKVSSGKLVIQFGDIYELPIEELAARLNEYRDWALSSNGPKSS